MKRALYRTHRSRSLDEVLGQEHITKTLTQAIKKGHISHAYLFTGPKGVGKTSVARILAREINGISHENPDDFNLDIIEIDAASNRRIEDIRDLREKVFIAPVTSKYKVYIIDEVHMLTGESFNALLKTLEEPPAHVVFILATTDLHKVPATIISRTQRYAFRLAPKEIVVTHLADIAKKENILIDTKALELIAAYGDGSYRDSISLLDQVSSMSESKKNITLEDVTQLLGLAAPDAINDLLEAVFNHDVKSVVDKLGDFEQIGIQPTTVTTSLIRAIKDAITTHPERIILLDALLGIEKSSLPSAKLLATLIKTAHVTEPISTSAPAAPSQQQAPKPQPTQKPKSVATNVTPQTVETLKIETTKRTVEPTKETIETTTIEKIETKAIDLSPYWEAILLKIKQHSPPLQGALSKAELRQAPDGHTVLAFKHKLYQNKAEDPKHKAILSEAIISIIGATVEIEACMDTKAVPTYKAPEKPVEAAEPMSQPSLAPIEKQKADVPDAMASIFATMGGGDVVSL